MTLLLFVSLNAVRSICDSKSPQDSSIKSLGFLYTPSSRSSLIVFAIEVSPPVNPFKYVSQLPNLSMYGAEVIPP